MLRWRMKINGLKLSKVANKAPHLYVAREAPGSGSCPASPPAYFSSHLLCPSPTLASATAGLQAFQVLESGVQLHDARMVASAWASTHAPCPPLSSCPTLRLSLSVPSPGRPCPARLLPRPQPGLLCTPASFRVCATNVMKRDFFTL